MLVHYADANIDRQTLVPSTAPARSLAAAATVTGRRLQQQQQRREVKVKTSPSRSEDDVETQVIELVLARVCLSSPSLARSQAESCGNELTVAEGNSCMSVTG